MHRRTASTGKIIDVRALESERRGRVGFYSEDYPNKAFQLAKIGATDKVMADFFEIGIATFYQWKERKAEFALAIQQGKDEADMEVQKSLYQKALGFTKITKKTTTRKDTHGEVIEIIESEDEQYHPPDTRAAMFILSNRQRANWCESTRTELNIGVNINKTIDIKGLSEDEQKMVRNITIKQLEEFSGVST